MIQRKARLKDIAHLSGVSVGTVDRVLHQRGEVAEKTRKRVLKIAGELNYTPNLIAQALKTKNRFNLISLLPVPTAENPFWNKHHQGIDKAMLELDHFPVNFSQITFDMNSEEDFQAKAEIVLKQNPHGILLAPLFKAESIAFCSVLKRKKIPFVFVDNYLNETGFLAYIGEDAYQSGRVAGQLADLITPPGKNILIVSIAKNLQNMNHLNNRSMGFLGYFSTSAKRDNKIIKLNIPCTDSEIIKNSMGRTFRKNPAISSIFVTGSKSYKIAEYVSSSGHRWVNVIGYDLLERNVSLLKEGKISFLIGQRPEEQTYRAVKKLFDFLSLKKVPEKMEYLPVDIVTSENVDFFITNLTSTI